MKAEVGGIREAEEEPTDKMLQCSHCPKEFRYNSERKRHELSHFPRFECETCSKKFSFVSALRRHQKQHERTGSVKCEECKRKFRDDVLLKRHIKYAHKGTFVCEKCDSKFSSELALRTHTKTHRPESERRFKCSHEGCTKSFNFSHHLKHHELTHTNAKQYYCSFCGKGFIQSHHLKSHLKAHDPAGWLFCEARGCRKRFHTDYARKRHMATHKNKPDSGISSDCNSCDASLSSSKDCTEESILCATCGETISQKEYKIHIATCINKKYSDIAAIINEDSDTINEEWPDSPFKPSAFKDHSAPKSIIDRDIGDCSMLLGCSIVNGENCICAQMAKPSSGNYDLTPLVININAVNSANENNINIGTYKNNPTGDLQHGISNSEIDEHKPEIVKVSSATNCNQHGISNSEIDEHKPEIVKVSSATNCNQISQNDMCEGCDCANICSAKVSLYDLTPKIVNRDSAAPNIEYRIDGGIKIIDNFDDDLVVKTKKDDFKSKRFVPFRTCKDVIGNCLVSGGDGCLCARMMADEDQAIMAQEIDDITPQPKTESS